MTRSRSRAGSPSLPPEPNWELVDFLQRFDEWAERADPVHGRRIAVLAWIQQLMTNPHRNATPTPDTGLPFWFGIVPDSGADGTRVVCNYRIDEGARQVRCSAFATLRDPIV